MALAILVDPEDEYLLLRSWCRNSEGYCHRRDKNTYVKLHRIIMKARPDQLVDHINRNKLDNRKCNLRFATVEENNRNRGPRITCKSGYKGVSKKGNKWAAAIRSSLGLVHSLGSFSTPELAAKAYNEAALKYHGAFAYQNIIGE